MGTVVVLAAQVGGAKLADGLYRLRGMDLAVVVNTGDDYRHLGLAFSPDLDTTLFTLAGIASATAGWEPEGETRALQGMLKQPGRRGAPVVAVTPVVGGKVLQGSAGKMMRELGREPTALGAATEYRSLADGFVIDREDLAFAEGVRSLGMRVLAVHTVMRTPEDRVALARSVLEFARSIREARAPEVE